MESTLMKKRVVLASFIFAFIVVGILGCSSTPQVGDAVWRSNAKLARQYSPFRIVPHSDGTFSRNWAGEPGRSITEDTPGLKRDVLRGFRSSCGFTAKQLIETRVVRHEDPDYYEVWVFADPASRRKDRTTGISVILKALPSGSYRIRIKGSCHSKS
jgi:hypothetical protein